MPKLSTVVAERERWKLVSAALLWDAPTDSIYEPEPPSPATPPVVKSSSTLSVTDFSPEHTPNELLSPTPLELRHRWVFVYRFLVSPLSNASDDASTEHSGYVEVSDSRLPSPLPAVVELSTPIPMGVVVQRIIQTGTPAPGDPTFPIVWAISGLRTGRSVLLAYQLEYELSLACEVAGTQPYAADLQIMKGAEALLTAPFEYEFRVTSLASNPGRLTLKLRDSRRAATDLLEGSWVGAAGAAPHIGPVTPIDGVYEFKIDAVEPNVECRLQLRTSYG